MEENPYKCPTNRTGLASFWASTLSNLKLRNYRKPGSFSSNAYTLPKCICEKQNFLQNGS